MPDRAQCEAVVRQLWPFVDGMVSDTERETILDHLVQCSDCNSHFDFAKAFLEAVHEAKPYFEVEDGLSERVMAALSGAGYRG